MLFVGTSIIHPSTEGVFLLCNILDLLIYSLDEPMNGLDNDGVMEMRKLFINLREEGTMIIIASHNKEDIEVLCDEVFEMEKGKLTPVQH